MATIAESNESMTVYYSKSTGIIRSISSGVEDMSFYGEQAEDMSIIQGYIVLPFRKDVFQNKDRYKINTDTLQLVKVFISEEEERIAKLEEENKSLKQSIEELREMVNNLTGSKEVQDNV